MMLTEFKHNISFLKSRVSFWVWRYKGAKST